MKNIKDIKMAFTSLAAFAVFTLTAKAGLIEVVSTYEGRGWYVHDIEVSYLLEGETRSMYVELNAGDSMIARGEGAVDVRDLDVAVYLPNGRLLLKDEDGDAAPRVPFTAPMSGMYRIDMKIYRLWSIVGGAEAALVLAER